MPEILHVGARFEVSAVRLADTGEGISQHESGVLIFTPGLWLNERAEVEVVEVKKRLVWTRLRKLLSVSDERVDKSSCALHGTGENSCGGCPWMFIQYEVQLKAKQARLVSLLEKNSIQAEQVLPILPSPKVLGYRNRASLKYDGKRLGFVSASKDEIVDIENCPILNVEMSNRLKQLRQLSLTNNWSRPKSPEPMRLDLNTHVDMESYNPRFRMKFEQANEDMNCEMKSWLKEELCRVREGSRVLELFCGDGNFSAVINQSSRIASCIAVEGSSEAVSALKRKKFSKVSAVRADLFKLESLRQLSKLALESEVLVLDPPRDGMKLLPQLLERMPKLNTILYISCHPITFMRDVKSVETLGFSLDKVQALDLFPQTPHMELVATLQRMNKP